MAPIIIHVRLVDQPDGVAPMVEWLEVIFGNAGLAVQVAPPAVLAAPHLTDLEINACQTGMPPTLPMLELFAQRNGAGPGDVVVYFVRSTIPPYSGCAVHPPGFPGAVVARGASLFTLAHEVCHVLGLGHVSDEHRIMHTPTLHIDPVPVLTPDEARIIRGDMPGAPESSFKDESPRKLPTFEAVDLAAALQDDEPDYDSLATLAPGALDGLASLVETGDPLLASKAAYLAGRIADLGSLPVLEAAARRPEAQVRVAVAGVVRHLQAAVPDFGEDPFALEAKGPRAPASSPPAWALLARLANDPDPGVRRVLASSQASGRE